MSIVYFNQTSERTKFISEAFAIEKIADKTRGKTVLIKPNMVSYEGYPTTTHLETIKATVGLLRTSAKEIVVGDGKAFDCNAEPTSFPISSLCKQLDVKFVDFSRTKIIGAKTSSGFDLEFSEMMVNFDFIISLPVLKYNFSTGITGALKNQYGFLSDNEKANLHKKSVKNIHKAIAELSRIRKPDFYIVDAIQTMICAQEKRHGGKLADLGFMLAGADPVSLDAFGFSLLQKKEKKLRKFMIKPNPEQILHLKFAAEFGVGSLYYELRKI